MKTKFLILSLTLAALVGCQRDKDVVLEDTDVVETISSNLKISNGGTLNDIQIASDISSLNPACNYQKDSSITSTGTNYNATLAWYWDVTCTNAIPTAINFTASGNSNINTTKLDYTGNSAFNYVVTGLALQSSSYIFNGTITRNGNTTLTLLNNTKEYSSNLGFTLNNLSVNKSTYIIESGSATFILTGTIANGSTYSKNGSIVFNGNGSATITLGGNTYNITL